MGADSTGLPRPLWGRGRQNSRSKLIRASYRLSAATRISSDGAVARRPRLGSLFPRNAFMARQLRRSHPRDGSTVHLSKIGVFARLIAGGSTIEDRGFYSPLGPLQPESSGFAKFSFAGPAAGRPGESRSSVVKRRGTVARPRQPCQLPFGNNLQELDQQAPASLSGRASQESKRHGPPHRSRHLAAFSPRPADRPNAPLAASRGAYNVKPRRRPVRRPIPCVPIPLIKGEQP